MKEIALITGASSGIGYEIAKLFAADKTDLLIVARDEKKLLEIKKEFEEQFRVNVFTVANSFAISYPIPDEAPVIKAISFIRVDLF